MSKLSFRRLGGILLCLALIFTSFPKFISASSSSDNGNGTFENPVIYADVPDCSVIRVGSNYYMVSTTMHLSPGVPIMMSTDLVNWEVVNYVYDTIADNDSANLKNGTNMYGKGSWAASLKYNAGIYYCSFMSYTTGKTYIYQTKDIENGTWTKYEINGCYHDMSLLFDTDGRVYMLYGGTDIKYIELNSACTGIKSGGASGTLFSGSGLVGTSLFEGTQVIKQNGYYYVFNIAWPSGKPRTQYCSRSKSLSGPWEHKIVLQTNFDNVSGVAQGGIVDTVDGKWYGMLFQDHGPVGRVPVLVPVTWQDNWPIMGNNGTSVSKTMAKPNNDSTVKTIIKSDEFDGTNSKKWTNGLDIVWQWNHNPDNNSWSMTQRAGYLRLTNGSIASTLTSARNTLTQRTYGPTCSGKVAIDITNMKNGDVAGLSAFSYNYGYVGVKMENGSKKLVMVNAQNESSPTEVATVSISTNKIYLKVDFNFSTNKANFYYSLDSKTWKQIGNTLSMSYSLVHFMGYRFGLFNYATQEVGGYVDFDYFRVSDDLKGACVESGDEVTTSSTPEISANPTITLEDGWYYVKNVNAQKYLQVKDNQGEAGANVDIGTGTGEAGQCWYLSNTGDGAVTLKSKLGEFALDVCNGSDTDGANIQIYHYWGGTAQQFAIQATSEENIYTVATLASNKTKNLDVYNYGKEDGTNVCQWTYGGGVNQQWIFEPIQSTPTVSATPSPSTETAITPSTSPEVTEGITYDYRIVSDWESSFQGELIITNNSSKTYSGWTLTCDYNSTITSLWGAELIGQDGTKVTLKNASWETSFMPGSSVTINFIATLGTDKNAPVNISFN